MTDGVGMGAQENEPKSGVAARVAEAKRAGASLAQGTGPERRAVLLSMADALERPEVRAKLLEANAQDVQEARAAQARGELAQALVDRLVLSDAKIDGLVDGLRTLAAKPDLIGQTTVARELDEGLVLKRVTCPIGVLGVVFEARPDAVPQIVGLAVRTGNAVVLKGGSEARRSNAALTKLLQGCMSQQGFDPAAIVLLEDRADVDALLQRDRDVDLVIARGSSKFVDYVMHNSRIPVLGHAEGLCHLYLHHSASPSMAARIAVDAKCSYPAACNAIETLLWEPGAEKALDAAVEALREQGVTLRGCPATRDRHPFVEPATDADWHTEYGDLTLSILRVDDIYGALRHIDRYGSRHTEAIVTEEDEAAGMFMAAVDAGNVFHNASTRFADGFRYGLGAEVGISTSKMHARGPVGVEGLVTYRWLLSGSGQVASDYGPGKKPFSHRDLT
jgi:glutamate-5-semialdehyde dehydrogenase